MQYPIKSDLYKLKTAISTTDMSHAGPHYTLAPWCQHLPAHTQAWDPLCQKMRWQYTHPEAQKRPQTPYEQLEEKFNMVYDQVTQQVADEKNTHDQWELLAVACAKLNTQRATFDAELAKLKQQQTEFYAEVAKFKREHRYDLELVKERRELDAMRVELEREKQLLAAQRCV